MPVYTRTLVTLRLPRSVPALLVRGRHVVLAMTGNAFFPAPSPALSVVGADLDALEAAETASMSRTKGTAQARNLKLAVAVGDLRGLQGYAQMIVDANPGQAAAIAESAGMGVRVTTPPAKPLIEALMASSPGTALVRTRARRGAAYEWQVSSDGGLSWTALPVTTLASTTVAGLAVGATYLFRVRTTVGSVVGEWSQAASLVIH